MRRSKQQIQNAATAMGMMAYSGKRGGFRNQSGGSTDFYEAGRQAAIAAHAAGGINGLLAFLAGFNAPQG